MNIDEFKRATTGMLLERPLFLRQDNKPEPISEILIYENELQLLTHPDGRQLTLAAIWQLTGEQKLVGMANDHKVSIFGYRVDGDDIILG